MNWIRENHAEELEVIFVGGDGINWRIVPQIEKGEEIIGGGQDGSRLEEGREYVTL